MTYKNLEEYYAKRRWFDEGGLWSCGYNNKGQLGDNTVNERQSHVQMVTGGTNWRQISSARYLVAAIKNDGSLWMCGYGTFGQLGDSTITNKSSPVQTIVGGTNWKQVTAGHYHTAAIKTDGTLWCWGRNDLGSVGDNTTAHKSSPIQTVAGGANWVRVSAGAGVTTGIKSDGTLWLWGSNADGSLGDNSSTNRQSPVQTVSAGTDWKQASGSVTTAAIKTDGTLWAWGLNTYGQLGDNTISPKSSPVQTVAGGTNWKQVAGGSYLIAAIKTDGSLWLCGYNSQGQMGDNTVAHKSSPVQTVAGGTGWKSIPYVIMGINVNAIKTDGTLWSWGFNNHGQLGDNTSTSRSSPVQTVAGGTNWKQAESGWHNSVALQENKW